MPDREIVIAQIGYGYWGPNLARNFMSLDGCRVKYICDSSPGKLEEAAANCPGATLVTDSAEVLGDPEVEGVVIAAPAVTHYELSSSALDSGRHVMVEKPMSLKVGEGRELVRAAEQAGLVLMVGHVFIYHPAVQYMKSFIDRGELGDIYYAYSQRLNLGRLRRDENCLWSLAPHDVSILLYLFGEMPDSVVARGASYVQGRLEDVVFFTLYFPDGRTGNVHVSWLDPRKVRLFTVVGSEKMIVYDDMSPDAKIKVFDKKVYPVAAHEIMDYREETRIHFGEESVPPLEMEEPLRIECRQFISSIRDGTIPPTGGAQGLEVLQVLEAAERSLERGGEVVEVERDDDR